MQMLNRAGTVPALHTYPFFCSDPWILNGLGTIGYHRRMFSFRIYIVFFLIHIKSVESATAEGMYFLFYSNVYYCSLQWSVHLLITPFLLCCLTA